MFHIRLVVVTLLTLFIIPLTAKCDPLYGKAAIVVIDAVTNRPLIGVKVTLDYANTEGKEVNLDVVQVKNNNGSTDEKGYVALPVYLGATIERRTRIMVHRVRVMAEKPGYQSLDGIATIFYLAFRKNNNLYVFLDDAMLSPEGNAEPSRIRHTMFRPEASIAPAWGDYQTKYVLTIKVQKPLALVHERDFDKPLLSIGLMGEDKNPLKPVLELNDDKKEPDVERNDGIYSGYIKPPGSSGEMIRERLPIVMRARDSWQTLHTEEGEYYSWERKESWSIVTHLIVATVCDLPVQWVVSDTKEKAEKLYEEHFGASNKP